MKNDFQMIREIQVEGDDVSRVGVIGRHVKDELAGMKTV